MSLLYLQDVTCLRSHSLFIIVKSVRSKSRVFCRCNFVCSLVLPLTHRSFSGTLVSSSHPCRYTPVVRGPYPWPRGQDQNGDGTLWFVQWRPRICVSPGLLKVTGRPEVVSPTEAQSPEEEPYRLNCYPSILPFDLSPFTLNCQIRINEDLLS